MNFALKEDGNMIDDFAQFDLEREIRDSEQRKPWPSGLLARTLVKRKDLRVVLISMEPGASLKEHHAYGSITVHVLRGEIRFCAQAQEHSLKVGQILTLGQSIKHAVESVAHSAFLLTISWPSPEELEALQHTGFSA